MIFSWLAVRWPEFSWISHLMSFGMIISGVVDLAIQSIKGWFLHYASCACVKDTFKMEDELISAKSSLRQSVQRLLSLFFLFLFYIILSSLILLQRFDLHIGSLERIVFLNSWFLGNLWPLLVDVFRHLIIWVHSISQLDFSALFLNF